MPKTAQKRSKKAKKLTSEQLRQKLKLKHLDTKKRLSTKHPKIEKFFKEKGVDPGKIREHSVKILGAGALTGTLLLTPPGDLKTLPTPQEIVAKLKTGELVKIDAQQGLLVDSFKSILPKRPGPLSRQEEKLLEQVFEQLIGVKVRATLEGEHLNTSYGYIGAEQHLRRYPGDSLSQHAPAESGSAGQGFGEILKSGIAPDSVPGVILRQTRLL